MEIRKRLGLAGVSKTESHAAQTWAKVFEYLMLFIAIWLPFEWYIERAELLSKTSILITTWAIWLFFITEYSALFILVKNKKLYVRQNWMNLIVILMGFPLFWYQVPIVGVLRGLQILLIVRLLLPLWDKCSTILSRNHLGTTLLVSFIVTSFWGMAMSLIEPTIKTPWDGIWWAWETITTVGYGDIIPATPLGRLFGIILMLMGIALISLLTANFSAFIIGKDTQRIKLEEDQALQMLKEIQEQLASINERINRVENEIKNK